MVDSADEVAESNSASFAKRMRTFHPTLVQNSGNRLMWIEGNHPAHSTTAYDCEFVPPPVANSDDRFEEYLEMIETVRDGPAHRLET